MTGTRGEVGFTLIEVIVSLLLFALIAMAGVAMVDGLLRVQGETTSRLDRLATLQRAMFVVSNDLDEIAAGPIDGGPARLSFARHARGGTTAPIAYAFNSGVIDRDIGRGQHQRLLDGIAGLRWRYYAAATGWVDRWPPDQKHTSEWPEAVSLEIALKPAANQPGGILRRLIALPMQP